MILVGVVLFLVFVGFAYNKNFNETDFPAQVAGLSIEETDEMINIINQVRLENNQSRITMDNELTEIAVTRSEDMKTRQYYAHTNPDGLTYNAYFQGSKGYSCENLNLLETDDIATTISSWMGSPDHKECLLDERLSFVGYSTIDIGDNRYVTALILSEL